MSPEQMLVDEDDPSREALSPATDVYSFGGTMLFLFTGKAPFSNFNAVPKVVAAVAAAWRATAPAAGRCCSPLSGWSSRCARAAGAERVRYRKLNAIAIRCEACIGCMLAW